MIDSTVGKKLKSGICTLLPLMAMSNDREVQFEDSGIDLRPCPA